MASEKFANLAETTLNASYTSGGTTLTVVSAAGFPTVGVFRVRLGNAGKTIWRVDSVSGVVFTGAAEANDANAAVADSVRIVASRAVAERWIQSQETTEIFAPSGLSAVDRYGPLYKVAYPVTADYSWQNQGTSTLDDQFGFTQLAIPSASTSVRSRLKTPPATPYKVDLLMKYNETQANSASKYAGLLFRESSTGKLAMFYILSTSNVCQLVYFTNDTTFSSAPSNFTLGGSVIGSLQPVWIRIRDDGTNLKFTASRDGKYYFTELSVSRTAHMAGAPNQIGFFANVDAAAGAFAHDYYSLIVS